MHDIQTLLQQMTAAERKQLLPHITEAVWEQLFRLDEAQLRQRLLEASKLAKFTAQEKQLLHMLVEASAPANAPLAQTRAAKPKRWYEKPISGLTKDARQHLRELEEQLTDQNRSHQVDRKQVRYLRQLKSMQMQVPKLFARTLEPKAFYQHLVTFCRDNDIPEEIVSHVVPALVDYIETGHMRPIIFWGNKGSGKSTSVKKLVAEALQLPVEIVKVPQLDGSHGLTGDSATYHCADAGILAKARLKNDNLLVCYVFDEIDKTVRNPSRASVDNELLSVTDESCSDVYDSFIESTLVGLEHCPIFFTANELTQINPILADRCTVIHFPDADSTRIKSIARKFTQTKLEGTLYSMISFDYGLMDAHIERLVQQNVTSLRKHQQMIEAVLGHALNLALVQEEDQIVHTTEAMFADAERAVLGADAKRKAGFVL